MLMRRAQLPDHLTNFHYPGALAARPVRRGKHCPEVLGAAPRRRAVRGDDPEDLLLTLRIDPENLRRPTFRADHVVTGFEVSDAPPAEVSQHSARERLGASAHEPER